MTRTLSRAPQVGVLPGPLPPRPEDVLPEPRRIVDLTDAGLAPREPLLPVEQAAVALQALDTLGVGLLVCDETMTVVSFDAAAGRLLGARPVHLRDDGDPPRFEVLREGGEPWPLPDRPLQSAVLVGAVTSSAVLGLRTTRGTRWMRVAARPLRSDGPPPYAALCTFTDVTADVLQRQELVESESRFRLLAEHSTDVIFRRAPDGRCVYVSPAAREVLGRGPDEVVALDPLELVHVDDRPAVRRLVRRLLRTGEPQSLRHRALHADGRVLWLETAGRAVPGPDGVEVQTSSRDVTVRVEAERRLARLALADPLTGLANRAALLQRLEDLIEEQAQVAVLFLDLDRFKVVNDSLGHSAGDELLRTVAQRLDDVAGPGGLVARLGGDEFVLLVPDVGQAAALALADVVHDVLARPLSVSGHDLVVTASIGVVAGPGPTGRPAEVLLRDADVAMYRAKSRGRATTVPWDEGLGSAAAGLLDIERDLRAGLQRGELVVHYQPQVELATGRIAGVEALVRWQHPLRGLLEPSSFLSVADDSGLVVELGDQVLEEAAAQVARWRTLPGHAALALSVNVSAQELQRPERVARTAELLARSGLPAEALTVEVLESVLLDAEGAVEASLHAYGRLGVRLALDDFGTGATSLLHLRQIPFDTVKVDRAFVSGLGACRRDEAIVRALQVLTQELGMCCVAEGVEQERQRCWLTAQGIGLAQGFLLHRPLPAEAVERLLTASPG